MGAEDQKPWKEKFMNDRQLSHGVAIRRFRATNLKSRDRMCLGVLDLAIR